MTGYANPEPSLTARQEGVETVRAIPWADACGKETVQTTNIALFPSRWQRKLTWYESWGRGFESPRGHQQFPPYTLSKFP